MWKWWWEKTWGKNSKKITPCKTNIVSNEQIERENIANQKLNRNQQKKCKFEQSKSNNNQNASNKLCFNCRDSVVYCSSIDFACVRIPIEICFFVWFLLIIIVVIILVVVCVSFFGYICCCCSCYIIWFVFVRYRHVQKLLITNMIHCFIGLDSPLYGWSKQI